MSLFVNVKGLKDVANVIQYQDDYFNFIDQLSAAKTNLELYLTKSEVIADQIKALETELRDKFAIANDLPKVRYAGESNATPDVSANLPSIPATGKAAEGYISFATIFADANENGSLSTGEAVSFTTSSGSFVMPGAVGTVILLGGIDIATGLPFQGHLSAPQGSSMVTPLTTLIVTLEKQGVVDAQAKVLAAFGLDPATDITTLDPIAGTTSGDAQAAPAYTAGIQVFDTFKLLASVLAGNEPSQFVPAYDAVLASMAGLVIAQGADLDLTDQGQIHELILIAAVTGGYSLDSAVVTGVETIITNLNQAVVDASGATGVDLLAALSAIALVAQGAASDALKDVHDNLSDITSVSDQFTGDNLAGAIETAKSNTGDVDGPSVENAPVAHDDAYVALGGTPLIVAPVGVLSNDTDADGNALTAALVTGPSHALSFVFNSDGSFSYTGTDGFSTDSFTYIANDGETDSPATTVTINIETDLNNDPIAAPDSNGVSTKSILSVSAANGVLKNDTDPDLQDQATLFISAVNGSAATVGQSIEGTYGSLTLKADGSYVYVANNGNLPSKFVVQDAFDYTVADAHGGTDTSTLTITLLNPEAKYQLGANTTLTGGNGKSVLDGSGGHANLIGGNGADVLIGGPGDILTGGRGPDTFLFRSEFVSSTITDFKFHEDGIQFDKSLFSSISDIASHMTDGSEGAVIADEHGNSLTFKGITATQLTAHLNDFYLV